MMNPASITACKDRLPRGRGLAGEDDRAHARRGEHAPALGERPGEFALVERDVLGALAELVRAIDDDFGILGNAPLAEERRMDISERAAHPDVEKVGKVGVGDGVVVGRIGDKSRRGIVGERVIRCRGLIDVTCGDVRLVRSATRPIRHRRPGSPARHLRGFSLRKVPHHPIA